MTKSPVAAAGCPTFTEVELVLFAGFGSLVEDRLPENVNVPAVVCASVSMAVALVLAASDPVVNTAVWPLTATEFDGDTLRIRMFDPSVFVIDTPATVSGPRFEIVIDTVKLSFTRTLV